MAPLFKRQALYNTASLHETTVQKAAVEPPVKKRRRAGKRSSSSAVTVTNWWDGLDEMLVEYLKKNKIHHSRIEKLSATEVIIHEKRM